MNYISQPNSHNISSSVSLFLFFSFPLFLLEYFPEDAAGEAGRIEDQADGGDGHHQSHGDGRAGDNSDTRSPHMGAVAGLKQLRWCRKDAKVAIRAPLPQACPAKLVATLPEEKERKGKGKREKGKNVTDEMLPASVRSAFVAASPSSFFSFFLFFSFFFLLLLLRALSLISCPTLMHLMWGHPPFFCTGAEQLGHFFV